VTRESDVLHFALLLRFNQRFDDAAFAIREVGIIIVGDGVNLPQIEMIRLQTTQGLFQHHHRERRITTVRANLRHDERSGAPTSAQPHAEELFRAVVVVFPRVVEERDAAVDGLVHDVDGIADRGGVSEMMAADSEGGNHVAMAPERALRNRVRRRRLRHGGVP